LNTAENLRAICEELNAIDARYTPVELIKKGAKRYIPLGDRQWQVLTTIDNKALLITEESVYSAYNDRDEEVTWETCTLREYLNGEFCDGFDPYERSLILETHNINKDNPKYGTAGGNDTGSDKHRD
jgi:hypothetical protein